MSRRRRLARAIAVTAGAALLALFAAELVVRTNRERFGMTPSRLWDLRALVCDGRGHFRPTAYYGWVFDATREGVNESGFLGPDVERTRRPGVTRIACLGGSTTGGSVYEGYAGSYPGALAAVLEQRLDRPVEVLNFGVPGWTTAESLVHWMLDGQDYRPDLVLVHHASNDLFPRLAPGFRSDYTHFFHPWSVHRPSWLHRFLTRWSDLYALPQLHDPELELFAQVATPEWDLPLEIAPGTEGAFRRNLESLIASVRGAGATPVLVTMAWDRTVDPTPRVRTYIRGLALHDAVVREVAQATACELFDLAQSDDPQLRESYRDLVHVTPEGNHRKAELAADFLIERGLVAR